MATIPAGFEEATFVFQCVGRPRVCTWSIGFNNELFPDPDPVGDAQAFYDAFTDVNSPYTAAKMCTGWTFNGVSVTKMQEDGPVIGQFIDPVVGTATNGSVPVNTAMLVNKNTTGGGRRNRGRAYVPPVWPPEEFVDAAGVMDSTRQGQLQGWYTNAVAALTAAEYTLLLFHQSAPFTPTPVTGLSVVSQMATQRRRMRS